MATAEFVAATARQIDVHDAVRTYRAHARRLRSLRNAPLAEGLRALERRAAACDRWERKLRVIELSLTLGGHDQLARSLNYLAHRPAPVSDADWLFFRVHRQEIRRALSLAV